MEHTFYKDDSGWFIDLPDFINNGLGTKANLAMVLGADTFLDKLSNNGNKIVLKLSTSEFENHDGVLNFLDLDCPENELHSVGHPIQVGAYYSDLESNHQIWLCPVTKYVFNGEYPENIFYKKIN
jgi:hypothetical protein